MRDLEPGWQERTNAEAAAALNALPARARPQRERPAYDPPAENKRPEPPDFGVVTIAWCPEHGLHGGRQSCYDCGGDVVPIPMQQLSGSGRHLIAEVQCSHRVGLAWLLDDGLLGVLPCLCNEPSKILRRFVLVETESSTEDLHVSVVSPPQLNRRGSDA